MSSAITAVAVAAVGAGLSYYNGQQQAKAAKKAGEMQAASADKASKAQLEMYYQNRSDMMPWMTAGTNSVNYLSYLMGLPGYEDPSQYATSSDGMTKRQIADEIRSTFPNHTLKYSDGSKKILSQQSDDFVISWAVEAQQHPEYWGKKPSKGQLDNLQYLTSQYKSYQTNTANMKTEYKNNQYGYGYLGDTTPTIDELQMDPGYEWRRNQGVEAIKAAGSAAGSLGSGNLGTALVNYGQDLSSQEYQNAYSRWMDERNTLYNRLAGISGTGQQQSTNIATLGQNTANNVAQNTIGAGDAQASALINSINAQTSGYKGAWNQLSALGSVFGGKYFAEGGRPPVNEASMVGEEGPEIFVPDEEGMVIPNENTETNPPNKRVVMLKEAIDRKMKKLKLIDKLLDDMEERGVKIKPGYYDERNKVAEAVRMLLMEMGKGPKNNIPVNTAVGGM